MNSALLAQFKYSLEYDALPTLYRLMVFHNIKTITLLLTNAKTVYIHIHMNYANNNHMIEKKDFVKGYMTEFFRPHKAQEPNFLTESIEILQILKKEIQYLKDYEKNLLTEINELSTLNDSFERNILLEKIIPLKEEEDEEQSPVPASYDDFIIFEDDDVDDGWVDDYGNIIR